MRVFIDDNQVSIFTARQMRDVDARPPKAETVEGPLLDLVTVDQRVTRAGRLFYGGLGAVVAVIIGGLVVGLTFGATGSEQRTVLPVAVVAALACVVMIRWAYRRGIRRWRDQREARAAALPPAGTRVRVDADGLTIGQAQAAWSRLVVEEVHFNKVAVSDDTSYWIERLALSVDGSHFLVDREFLREGQAIVKFAYVKLVVERGLEELWGEAVDAAPVAGG